MCSLIFTDLTAFVNDDNEEYNKMIMNNIIKGVWLKNDGLKSKK